jgi:hypothetical protein
MKDLGLPFFLTSVKLEHVANEIFLKGKKSEQS